MRFLAYLLQALGPEVVIVVLEGLAQQGKLSPAENAALQTMIKLEPIIGAGTPGEVQFVPADGSPAVPLFHYTP